MDELDELRAKAVEDMSARTGCAPYLAAFRGARVDEGDAVSTRLRGRDARATAAHMEEAASVVGGGSTLAGAMIAARSRLLWRCGYADDVAAGDNYHERAAAAVLCGPGAPFEGGTPEAPGRGGVFFVREGVRYAPHMHAPDEIYAIVAGRARFWSEAGWREAGAGETIFTPSWAPHGMETTMGPVLILWAWIGDGLDAPLTIC